MRVFTFILFISVSLSFAQKQTVTENIPIHYVDSKKCKSSFSKTYIGASDTSHIKQYLFDHIPFLKQPGVGLSHINTTESPAGMHFQFIQLYNHIPVYRSLIKVNMDKTGSVYSVFDNTFSFNQINIPINFPDSSSSPFMFNNIKSKSYSYFFKSDNQCVAALRIEYINEQNNLMEAIIDVSLNTLYSRCLDVFYSTALTDSTVSARVFNPDPLTTAGVSYGGSYRDFGDTDVPVLNSERELVTMKVNFSNDTFSLQRPYVVIKDFWAPVAAPVYVVSTPSFNFLRSQTGFEDVNAYYHITNYQQHIQSLGFTNIVNYPIWVDTRGTTMDNSFFSPGYSPPRLTFGTGGVDDAEDADVVIHEYGHAMSHSAAPNTNAGIERQAIDEANGDYFAASYSKNLNTYNWQNVYTWDGHNEYWSGRQVVSSKHYPEDVASDIYLDAEIWSATLMQIWDDIGRNEADATLIQSIYGYAVNMTMEDAANLYIQADALLFAGKNADVLCQRFSTRGLFENCFINPNDGKNTHIFNSKGFADGSGIIIRFVNEVETATFSLYNTLGQKIFTIQKNNTKLFILKGDSYPDGIYIVKVETPVETTSFKLIND